MKIVPLRSPQRGPCLPAFILKAKTHPITSQKILKKMEVSSKTKKERCSTVKPRFPNLAPFWL